MRSQSPLQFSEEYVGIFVSGSRAPNAQFPAPTFGSFWVYEHRRGLIALAIGGKHAEPLTHWLRVMHNRQIGMSALAAKLRYTRQPRDDDDYFFSFPYLDKNFRKLIRTLNPDEYAVFFTPHDLRLLVLTKGEAGLKLAELLPETEPITGLVLRVHSQEPDIDVNTSGGLIPYDPIEAQVREIAGPLANAANEAIDRLATTWKSTFAELPNEIASAPAEIRSSLAEIARLKSSEKGRSALKILDIYGQYFEGLTRRANRVTNKLRLYHQSALPNENRTYEDVAHRMNLGSIELVPVLGTNYSLEEIRLSIENDSAEPSTYLINQPAQSRLRLGALPLISHEVAHAAINRDSRLWTTLFAEEQTNALLKLCLSEAPSPLTHRSPLVEVQLEVEKRHRIAAKSQELLADLMATAASGPAFVYAMARFALGTLREFAGDGIKQDNFPPFPLRIRACLALLRGLDINYRFSSRYLPDSSEALPQSLVNAIADEVEVCKLHNDPKIRTELRAGRISSYRPTEILNTLWQSVVNKSGYIHELAAVISVAGVGQTGRRSQGRK